MLDAAQAAGGWTSKPAPMMVAGYSLQVELAVPLVIGALVTLCGIVACGTADCADVAVGAGPEIPGHADRGIDTSVGGSASVSKCVCGGGGEGEGSLCPMDMLLTCG